MKKVRWGMVGTGMIAKSFAKDFQFVEDGDLVAVAGRDYGKTKNFADIHKIDLCFSSVEEMVNSCEIDAVYIATPHSSHHSLCMMGLEVGKHILVEKPFMMNEHEARQAFDFAKQQKLFLAEAMWTCFLPFVRELKRIILEGRIGEIQAIQSSMGFPFRNGKPERLFSKDLGGGALLDMGVYSIAFAQMIRPDIPKEVISKSVIGPTGVDHKSTWVFTYQDGCQSIGACSIDSAMAHEAVVSGSLGQIRVPDFWRAKYFYVGNEEFLCDYEGTGLHFQVSAANRYIQCNELEAKEMRWRDSLTVLNLCDQIRRSSNITYPTDRIDT